MFFHKRNDNNFGIIPPLTINGKEITRVFKFKYLGIMLDPTLTFRDHLHYVESKLSSGIGRLRGINRLVPDEVFITLVKAYIIPIYDYCLDIWAVATDNELSIIQNKIDRLLIGHFLPSIVRKSKRNSKRNTGRHDNLNNTSINFQDFSKIDVTPLLTRCHLLTIQERIFWTLVKNVRSCIMSPVESISNIYNFSDNNYTSRTFPLLKVEASNSITLRKSIKFRAIKAWNTLPKNWIFNINSTVVSDNEFKKDVFNLLISQRSDLCYNL